MSPTLKKDDHTYMTQALSLARKGWGFTSPNPCVGAVLVKAGRVIGQGWHRRAGRPHAEVEAFRNAERNGASAKGATLYVTLEPCSTTGRTPPCCDAIVEAGVKRVVIAARDPNPKHVGRGVRLLRRAGIQVNLGLMAAEANTLNEAFNHWIVSQTPLVTVKAAMTLDGRIATAKGASEWITGPMARRHAMNTLRRPADAILVGIQTVLADDPSLTYRGRGRRRKSWRRIVLDTNARTPLRSRVITDEHADTTLIVVGEQAPLARVKALSSRVEVWQLPTRKGRIDLRQLLTRLGQADVTSLLVEGGGEVNGSFLRERLAQRVAFYFAPKILGGRGSVPGIAGGDPGSLLDAVEIADMDVSMVGPDVFITGRVKG